MSWLAGFMAFLVLAQPLALLGGSRATARTMGQPAGAPVSEEENPSEETRCNNASGTLHSSPWRSKRHNRPRARRIALFRQPRSLTIATRLALGRDLWAGGRDEAIPQFDALLAFHYWVRSQTW